MGGPGQAWGQFRHKANLVHSAGRAAGLVQKTQTGRPGSRPQGSSPAKPLWEKAKIRFSPATLVAYYDYQA